MFRRRATASEEPVLVIVRDGYHPAIVERSAGRPVTIAFRREERTTSSKAVLLRDLGLYSELPEGQTTTIACGMLAAGDYEFCSTDGLLRGLLRIR